MGTCYYDNPDPAQREIWVDGTLVLAIPEDRLRSEDGRIESLRSGCPFTMFSPPQTEGDILAIPEGHHVLSTTTIYQAKYSSAALNKFAMEALAPIKNVLDGWRAKP